MKFRSFGLLAALLAYSAGAQEKAAGVTLESKAAPLSTILQIVSAQTGLKLEAGALKDVPVIVRVADMPAKQFVDSLAKVLDAEWSKLGDQFTLVRGPGRLRAAEAAEAEARVSWVVEAVQKFIADSAASTDWSDAAIEKRIKEDAARKAKLLENIRGAGDNMRISLVDSGASSPGMLVLIEALKKLPAKALAGILPGQRIVWANTPTRMQKQLPYSTASLEAFVKAYNKVLAANRSMAESAPENVRVETPLSKRGDPLTALPKLIVIGQRHEAGLQVSALIVGPQGQILDRPQAWLGSPVIPSGTVPEGIGGEATLSDASKKLIQGLRADTTQNSNQVQFQVSLGDNFSGSIGNEPPTRVLPEGVAEILASPQTNEPMSFFVSEVLLQMAASQKKNLIAHAPDMSFAPFMAKLAGGRMKFADLFQNGPALGIELTMGDAILVTPSNWAQAERSKVNRTELGRLTGAVVKKGYATLDETCRYALAMPAWAATNLDALWLAAICPAEHAKYSANQNVFYKMYGTLTPAQRQANAQRVAILANQMSAQQRSLLEEIVYRPGGPQIIGNGQMMTTSVVSGSGPAPGQERPEPEILVVEPTEAFPNGLPPNTRLEIGRRFMDGVYAIDSSGRGRFLSAGDLGLRLGLDKSTLPPGTTIDTQFSKYQLADMIVVDLNVSFGRRGRNASLRDAAIRGAAAAVGFSQLPKGFLDNVDRARQRAMNMRTMSVGGGGTPPP